MGRIHSYLNSAVKAINKYDGKEPFSSSIKKFFAAGKKSGSTDRKHISHLCYCYFRLGKAVMNLPAEERILTGLFLCSSESNEVLKAIRPSWNDKVMASLEEKSLMLQAANPRDQFSISDVFPWKDELGEGIDHNKFCESFFIQPDLFARIRPGHTEKVLLKLNSLEIDYEFISPFSVRLPNSFKADRHFELDKEIVIQDYNSQKLQNFLPVNPGHADRVWDCCAGSGGKSIMTFDLDPSIHLTVSDKRESILVNLKKRFQKAGIRHYKSIQIDFENRNVRNPIINNQFSIINNPGLANKGFSIIIADVPCTGSGTWNRTPEQLYFFHPESIVKYNLLQKKIVSNTIPYLQAGGYYVYITCSVFKRENDDIVKFIKEQFHLQAEQVELLKGYDKKADTMFVAVFKKPFS